MTATNPVTPFKSNQDATKYNSGAAVSPDDVATIAVTRGVYVGGAGDLKVTFADGTSATLKAAPLGVYPIMVQQVFATGTTATNIVALY